MATASEHGNQDILFISRIGDDGSDVRFKSDLVLNTIIRPAAQAAGFHGAERADEMNMPGRITDQVIKRIVEGPAVGADLTGLNPNVFYEVAIAHAAKKPLVQNIEDSEPFIPFDITDQNTIKYNETRFDSLLNARERVSGQLRKVVENPSLVDNPIQTAMRFIGLEVATTPGEIKLADVLLEMRVQRGLIQELRNLMTHTSMLTQMPEAGVSGGGGGSFVTPGFRQALPGAVSVPVIIALEDGEQSMVASATVYN